MVHHTQRLERGDQVPSTLNFHKLCRCTTPGYRTSVRHTALTTLEEDFSCKERRLGKWKLLSPFSKAVQVAVFTHHPRQSAARSARSQRHPSAFELVCRRCPWYWQRSAGTGRQETPWELLTPSPVSFALWFALSTCLRGGHAVAAAAGAIASPCSPQAPTVASQGNQRLGTRPVPGASSLPRPTRWLSWAESRGSACLPQRCGEVWEERAVLGVSMAHSLVCQRKHPS